MTPERLASHSKQHAKQEDYGRVNVVAATIAQVLTRNRQKHEVRKNLIAGLGRVARKYGQVEELRNFLLFLNN
jgi:lysylphosphatidylglycerol synthetase-like protein (DUF2156 family)